jgi:hypothetical protein
LEGDCYNCEHAPLAKKTELFPSNVPMIYFPELMTPEIMAQDEWIGLEQEREDGTDDPARRLED